jgi:hypothetical protein
VEQQDKDRVVVCFRCQLEVSVVSDDSGLKLSYDVEHWGKKCCCPDRASPVECCSFLTLEGVANMLPRSPKGGD